MRRQKMPRYGLQAAVQALLSLALLAGALPSAAQEAEATLGEEELLIADSPARSFDAAAPTDEEIRERLTSLFGRIDGLSEIEVSVDSGVVVLDGVVQRSADREAAVQIANRFDGIAAVQNRLDLDRRLSSRLDTGTERLRDGFLEFIAALPSLLAALAVAVLFWLVGGWLARRDRMYGKLSRNAFLKALLQRTTHAVFAVAGLVAALFIMNAGGLLGSIAGALGIVGLAIGFATRDTVENFIASILLSVRQPFARLDHVLIGDQEGKVMRLSSRATVLMSLDGNHIRIPNSTVFKSTITNYSRNPRRRFNFDVGVDTDLDLGIAIGLALETLGDIDGVLDDPEPACIVRKLGDSSVVLAIFGWVDQRSADFFAVRSNALQAVKVAFDKHGIVMPEPIYNVNLRRGRPAVARPADPESSAPQDAAVSESRLSESIDRQIDSDPASRDDDNLLSSTAPQE